MTEEAENQWFEDESLDEEVDYPLGEYDLYAAPSDFNIMTLNHFMESGTVKIPGFQRNYVWDIKLASKFIESIIMGLPVPQIFLYEEGRNQFLVIDGQQRLMSIYYFIKKRFPRKEKRTALRRIFDEHGKIPDKFLEDECYFEKFNLVLPNSLPDQQNKFHQLNYDTLGEKRSNFDLRAIRSIIMKPGTPKNDDSAVYEIFNRLNSGGVTLTSQEVRMSLYHSDFYEMLSRINLKEEWQALIGLTESPDLHLKDLEFLLRGFALLTKQDHYQPSMVKFLNKFSREAKAFDQEKIKYLETLFLSFLKSCSSLDRGAFQNLAKRFSITYFESIFVATCQTAYRNHTFVSKKIDPQSVETLRQDKEFLAAAERTTTSRANVLTRLRRARHIIKLQ